MLDPQSNTQPRTVHPSTTQVERGTFKTEAECPTPAGLVHILILETRFLERVAIFDRWSATHGARYERRPAVRWTVTMTGPRGAVCINSGDRFEGSDGKTRIVPSFPNHIEATFWAMDLAEEEAAAHLDRQRKQAIDRTPIPGQTVVRTPQQSLGRRMGILGYSSEEGKRLCEEILGLETGTLESRKHLDRAQVATVHAVLDQMEAAPEGSFPEGMQTMEVA